MAALSGADEFPEKRGRGQGRGAAPSPAFIHPGKHLPHYNLLSQGEKERGDR